ncbi:hypothetical protein DZA37_00985 [Kangiella sp. HD9-110m-PIT-SAG06]|nr:hypothetical protein DZA37_00985 [Kangiella sp. HD9-110m-PIT-SAG06]
MGKQILAVMVGVVVGGLAIYGIESINMVRFPWPENLSMEDEAAFAEYVSSLPVDAFITVIIAHAVGSFISGFVCCRITPSKHLLFGTICGVLFLLAGIMNLIMIPHPLWFMIVDVLVFVPFAWLGAKLAK